MSDTRGEVDWISRAIALVEIVGGVTAAGVVAWGLLHGPSFFGLLFLAIYVWCAFAGVQLWRQRRTGWRHSVLVQLLQTVWVDTAKFTYLFAAGCGAWFGFGSEGITRRHAWLSEFQLGWRSGFGPQFDAHPWLIAVNIVALAAAVYLLWFRPKNA
jgi:hypothetical protein